MATVNPLNDPNQQQQPGQQPATGGSGGAASAAAGVGGTQPVSPVQQNQAPQQNASFNDVSAYLNANQQGGNQLGQQVAQNVTNQYNTTKQNIDTSANAAVSQANAGYTPENTQLIQQVAANPTQATANPSGVNAFQAQLNDLYSGPTAYADLGTQRGNVANAQQYGNLINTPGGANVLTQQVENQLNPGQSSAGVNALDTLLLTGNPQAAQTVKTAATPYNDLGTYLNSQAGNVINAIQSGQTAANQAAQDALAAFTGPQGALTGLNTQIGTETQAAQAAAAKENTDLANALKIGKINPDQAKELGLTDTQLANLRQNENAIGGLTTPLPNSLPQTISIIDKNGNPTQVTVPMGTYNQDISSFLTPIAPTAITAGTVATPQQYQEMAAIQNLLGTKTPQGTAINPAMATEAGTAPTNPNFDYQAALNQLYTELANSQVQPQAGVPQQNTPGKGSNYLQDVVAPFFNPVQTVTDIGSLFAHGGEVQDIDQYLNKRK